MTMRGEIRTLVAQHDLNAASSLPDHELVARVEGG
jgi:hypothetical protein